MGMATSSHMNDALRAHLAHWHFHSAASCLTGEPEAVRTLVDALAVLVGDCGYEIGGALSTVIEAALGALTQEADRHERG